MNTPPLFNTFLASFINTQIISAIIFATTISAFPSTTSTKFPYKTSILSKLLYETFSLAESTATGSKSTPTTFLAPSFEATIASIPEPVPISKTVYLSLYTYLKL